MSARSQSARRDAGRSPSPARARAISVRKDQIRLAALELFAVQGFRPTTMAAIGEHAGIRGPSIYRHYSSKQDLLQDIVFTTMSDLIAAHERAVAGAADPPGQLRRATEAHVRYHARHRFEAAVGNREIPSVDEPARSRLLGLRATYETGFRSIIDAGRAEGSFQVDSPRLASYAILDMGMGVALWYREDGPHSEDEVVHQYGDLALRMCRPPDPAH